MFDRLTRGASETRDGGRLGKLGDGSIVQMSARTTKDGSRRRLFALVPRGRALGSEK